MAKPMSLREQLAAKRPRTAVVPVQVSDPGPALRRVQQLERTLTMRQFASKDDVAILEAETDLEAARAELAEHYVEIQFQALLPRDLEELQDAHTGPDGEEDTETFVPALAAACVVDEDLKDPAWWAGQRDSGGWGWGEWQELHNTLVALNYEASRPHLPKG